MSDKKKYKNLVGRLTDEEYRKLSPRDRPSLCRLSEKEYRELCKNTPREGKKNEI
jgi:hypothetical protein